MHPDRPRETWQQDLQTAARDLPQPYGTVFRELLVRKFDRLSHLNCLRTTNPDARLALAVGVFVEICLLPPAVTTHRDSTVSLGNDVLTETESRALAALLALLAHDKQSDPGRQTRHGHGYRGVEEALALVPHLLVGLEAAVAELCELEIADPRRPTDLLAS